VFASATERAGLRLQVNCKGSRIRDVENKACLSMLLLHTFLRQQRCPDGVLKFWTGHAARDMTDHYDRSREDVQYRKDVARAMGVGFELPKALSTHPAQTREPGVEPFTIN
jgi:hypothetical protein